MWSPFKWLFGRKQAEMTMPVGPGTAQWTDRDYGKLSEEGYQKNIVAYRCITLIARSLASVPWLAFNGDTELENHPILDLLKSPNPQQGRSAFFEAVESYYLIAGNLYLREFGPDGKPPRELWTLRPERMKVKAGPGGRIAGYEYRVGTKTVTFPVDPLTGRSEILHIKTFHPTSDYYGLSPLAAAAFSIDQHNAAGEHNYKLLKNGARPSGALTYKPNDVMPQNLADPQFNRLKRELQEQYSGPSNAGRPMLLDGGMTWQQIMLSPIEMDFLNLKNTSARDIAAAYGVPPMLIGILGDATFANYKEARLALWEDRVIPDLVTIQDELNRWLSPLYGENVRLEFDADEVPALAGKRQDTWEKLEGAGFLKINEKREAVGYEEVDGGDVILVPAMMLPLGEDVDNAAATMTPKEAAEVGYGIS